MDHSEQRHLPSLSDKLWMTRHVCDVCGQLGSTPNNPMKSILTVQFSSLKKKYFHVGFLVFSQPNKHKHKGLMSYFRAWSRSFVPNNSWVKFLSPSQTYSPIKLASVLPNLPPFCFATHSKIGQCAVLKPPWDALRVTNSSSSSTAHRGTKFFVLQTNREMG